MSPQDVRADDVGRRMCGLTMWDVAEKQITNEHVRGMVVETYHHGCLRRMCAG
jgi:hypothetical protein